MAIGLKSVTTRRDDALAGEAWDRVEHLLADYYRKEGYEVEHCGTGGRSARFDGGVDLRLRRGAETIVVQCKHWNAYKVPHNEVHQLLGIMVNEQATGAILVTSGEFTKAAIEAAGRHRHVQLVDGDDLRAMLGPLPKCDPDPRPDAGGTAGGWKGATSAFGSYAAERLIAAAEDRIRHGGGRRGRSAVATGAWAGLMVIGLKLAFGLALLYFGSMYIQNAIRNLQPARPVAGQAVGRPPAVRAPAAAPTARAGAAPQDPAVSAAPVIHEVAPDDMAEWKRRNAESMEILRESTPEVTLAPPGR